MSAAGFVVWIAAVVILASVWGIFLAIGSTPRKRGALTDEELAAYIRLNREYDMRRFYAIYPTEEIWNQEAMRSTVRSAASFPRQAREEAREFIAGEGLMERAARVDPVERERRIREMEREVGL